MTVRIQVTIRKETTTTSIDIELLDKTAENYCSNIDWYMVLKFVPTDASGTVGQLVNVTPFGVYTNPNQRGSVCWCVSRLLAPAPDSTGSSDNVAYLTSIMCHMRRLCYGEVYHYTLSDLTISQTKYQVFDVDKISKNGKFIIAVNAIYHKSGGSTVTISSMDLGNDEKTRDFCLEMFLSSQPVPYPRNGAAASVISALRSDMLVQ